MSTIFTKIIHGEIPSYKIAENEYCYAFLDINPNTVGHTLVVPKKEIDKIMDLDEKTYQELMLFSKKIGMAIENAIDCKRVGMAVIGLEVPHVHVHLIPLKEMEDMNFSKKVSLTEEEFIQTASRIREAIK
jgi:histidine triad (HIT) family protein